MAGNLHIIAATGTDNLSEQIDTKHITLDYLLNEMSPQDNAARLLRGAGLLTLREKAGYIPPHDPRAIEKIMPVDGEHKQDSYSSDILRILNAIYWGSYIETYPEWLHWVALDDHTFPYEALPLMLNLASWFPPTQGLTKRVLGSRGRWLVEQSGHRGWHWAKHIKPARRPRLSKYTKNEARIVDQLARIRYRTLTIEINYELRRMTFPWSQRFSEAITRSIESMFTLRYRLQVDDLIRIANTVQWYIHPSQCDALVAAFRNYNELEEIQAVARELEVLLQFRAELTAVFNIND